MISSADLQRFQTDKEVMDKWFQLANEAADALCAIGKGKKPVREPREISHDINALRPLAEQAVRRISKERLFNQPGPRSN